MSFSLSLQDDCIILSRDTWYIDLLYVHNWWEPNNLVCLVHGGASVRIFLVYGRFMVSGIRDANFPLHATTSATSGDQTDSGVSEALSFQIQ